MTIFLIIISIVLFALAIVVLFRRQIIAPALAYCGLLALSFNGSSGYPVLPLNSTIMISWLCLTVVVMMATMLQPDAIRLQIRGMGYIIAGAFTGMIVGLLGFTFIAKLSALYGVMIAATVVGTFLGFLFYTRTPDGTPVNPRSGNFFRYLLAKGFPVAITVMQCGVALVLALALQ